MSKQCDGDVTEPHDSMIDVINAYKKDEDGALCTRIYGLRWRSGC